MFSLEGKVCVVTGAGKGLGRAIATTYAAQGAKIVAAARGLQDLESLKAEIEAKGGEVAICTTDVTSRKAMESLGEAALAAFGHVDVWVNNAGGFIDGAMCDWIDVEEDALDAMLRLNLVSFVYGAQVAGKLMRAAGKGGSIILMSSLDAFNPAPGGEGCYGACKIALNHITETLAIELGQYGIRVNAIAPGVVDTPLTAPFLTTDEIRADRASFYPLGRIGQPADVAAAAVYFASDEAGYVSGAKLLVSGGAVFNSDPYRYMMKVAAEKKAKAGV
ncbi:SDR family NAD(P)-dependent oxidoreductase [Ancylobacter pratisalsi]|uniref:Glucose 1-dehydrogenase n=1 Tax=Ancylobacter pratisalsi TaxID=1745854 RepID=A0A6P1YN84_9HYPH|nr:glucose 1-dehydrogenase [Ancylobacter pratisalsi]QIB34595.1 glucose 1-dehydrogenase [Ancylobacter pratisalsi]